MSVAQRYKKPRKTESRHRILAFIREHPNGVSRGDIRRGCPDIADGTINTGLTHLHNNNVIYNNGATSTKGTLWYPKTHETPDPFPAIAVELIDELRDVYYAKQEFHLAKRLHEIFGGQGETRTRRKGRR